MTRAVAGLVLCAMIVASRGDADGAAPATTAASAMASTTPPPQTATTTTTRDTTTSTSSPVPSQPRPGGIVTVGDDQSPPTLNPYVDGGDNFAFTYATLAAPEYADAQFGAFEDYQLIDAGSMVVGAKSFAFTMPQATLAREQPSAG